MTLDYRASGFDAKLGGARADGFEVIEEFGMYWTSSVDWDNTKEAYVFYFSASSKNIGVTTKNINNYYSCRCIKED